MYVYYIYRTRMTHHQPHLALAKAKGNCEYLLISPFWVISPDIAVKNTWKTITIKHIYTYIYHVVLGHKIPHPPYVMQKTHSPTHSERADFQNELVQTPANIWALATPSVFFVPSIGFWHLKSSKHTCSICSRRQISRKWFASSSFNIFWASKAISGSKG